MMFHLSSVHKENGNFIGKNQDSIESFYPEDASGTKSSLTLENESTGSKDNRNMDREKNGSKYYAKIDGAHLLNPDLSHFQMSKNQFVSPEHTNELDNPDPEKSSITRPIDYSDVVMEKEKKD